MKDLEKAQLEKKITALSKALAKLSHGEGDIKELLLIIKRPGWTTPAEFQFTIGLADVMLQQIKVIQEAQQALLAGAKAVGMPVRG